MKNFLVTMFMVGLVAAADVFAAGGGSYGRVNEGMSWDQIRASWKVNILNDKIAYGDALGRKMSVFNLCKTEDGGFQSVERVSICDDADLVGRGQWRCASSDYRIVEFSDKFEDSVCATPRCESRRKVAKSLGKSVDLMVYTRGEGRQGPYHKYLFKKEYTFPSCR